MRILFSSTSIFLQQKQVFKSLALLSQGIALPVYGFVRLLFYQFPITSTEEATLLLKTAGLGVLLSLVLYGLFLLYGVLKKFVRTVKIPALRPVRYAAALLVAGVVFFTSCARLLGLFV